MFHTPFPPDGENRLFLEREGFSPQYDPEPRRDHIRAGIACGLIVLLIGMVCYAFQTTHGEFEKTRELLEILLPAVLGLLGSALGFYFGSKA